MTLYTLTQYLSAFGPYLILIGALGVDLYLIIKNRIVR